MPLESENSFSLDADLFQTEGLFAWQWDPQNDVLKVNGNWAKLIGIHAKQYYRWSDFLSWCPEYSRVGLNHIQEKMLSDERGFSFPLEMKTALGDVSEFRMRWFVQYDVASRAKHVVVIGWAEDGISTHFTTKREWMPVGKQREIKQEAQSVSPQAGQFAQLLSQNVRESLNLVDFLDVGRLADLAQYSQGLISGLIQVFLEERQEHRCTFPVYDYLLGMQKRFSGEPNVQIRLCIESHDHVELSPALTEIIFRNLIHNAIQHNDKPIKKVILGYRRKGGKGVFYVQDNGPGLSVGQVAKLDAPNLHDVKENNSIANGGLGLYLVKRLMQRKQAELSCESQRGEGTTISFDVL